MDEEHFLERAKQFAYRLAELRNRLDPDSYDLLLRILRGINDAILHRTDGIEVPFSPRDQDRFTPAFGQELAELTSLLGPHGLRLVVDFGAERERDRLEVEAIARVSGMDPGRS
ncbi:MULTISPECIES: hypothetical protein [Streptomyces]|uniref:Uncharacterized protein n=1 Tax=Streptomyces lonegramiae TaxID=3075524 RepID=A0ABU2XKG2_9ACTN|nr:hypothetical protein [Streptomyces sp. DSM 41529]MDT0546411.1 hypothetical protein [Streptomyces sp. DSM 41529]